MRGRRPLQARSQKSISLANHLALEDGLGACFRIVGVGEGTLSGPEMICSSAPADVAIMTDHLSARSIPIHTPRAHFRTHRAGRCDPAPPVSRSMASASIGARRRR